VSRKTILIYWPIIYQFKEGKGGNNYKANLQKPLIGFHVREFGVSFDHQVKTNANVGQKLVGALLNLILEIIGKPAKIANFCHKLAVKTGCKLKNTAKSLPLKTTNFQKCTALF